MARRNRWMIAFVVLLILGVGAFIWNWRRCPSELGSILQVKCSHKGGNATDDYWWNLDLDANGNGTLTVNPGFTEKRRKISMPHKMAELEQAVRECRFCELPPQIGHAVVDAGTDRMRIKSTNIDKTITMDFVDPSKVNEDVRCAYHIWKIIQECVDHSKAAK